MSNMKSETPALEKKKGPAKPFTSIHSIVENDDRNISDPEMLAFMGLDKNQEGIKYELFDSLAFSNDTSLGLFSSSSKQLDFVDSSNISPVSTSSSSPNIDKPAPSADSATSSGAQRNSSVKRPISRSSSQVSVNDKAKSEILSNYQFGKELSSSILKQLQNDSLNSESPDMTTPPSYMPEFNADDWSDVSHFKYQLKVQDIPDKSRVETQIKMVVNIFPPPTEDLIHLPADTIAKPKLQLKNRFVPSAGVLSVDTIVVCESDHRRHVNICQGCMKRERKRAFRKKSRLPIEEAHWSMDKEKRAIVFNCRELVQIGPIVPLSVDGKYIDSRQVKLPMRIPCYCRHHNEKLGFRVFFVVRNHAGKVVARGSSDSITITDDHKASIPKPVAGVKRSSSDVDEDNLLNWSSPEGDGPRKRRAEASPNDSLLYPGPSGSTGSSPAVLNGIQTSVALPVSPQYNDWKSSIDTVTMNSRLASTVHTPGESPQNLVSPSDLTENWGVFTDVVPDIKQIIPASGSVRGGIDVTLLGFGFIQGLVTKFGENSSSNTIWWNGNTIVSILPPSRVAGPVVVTFEGFTMTNPKVFSYYDDTDNQLIQLALQVVGLKMNGRLEDAREIARRIVSGGTTFNVNNIRLLESVHNQTTQLSMEELESLVLQCFTLIDSYHDDTYTPNWQLSNNEGQSMLHLSASLGLVKVSKSLLERGSRIDCQDKSGYTPLHFAGLNRREDMITLLLENGANPQLKTYSGYSYIRLRDSETSLVPITLDSYTFKGPSPSDSDESASDEYSEISSDEMSVDGEEEEYDDDEEIELQIKVKKKGLAGFLASWSGFRKNSGAETLEEHEQTFWNMIYPNTGEITHEEDSVVVQEPPRYEELFPAGSSSSVDYSGAAIDDEKPSKQRIEEVSTAEQEMSTATTTQMSDEEILQTIKLKRKKIQNDLMFLCFWLPVFIFILVWAYMKTKSVYLTMDKAAPLGEKVVRICKGLLGIKKGTLPPAVESSQSI